MKPSKSLFAPLFVAAVVTLSAFATVAAELPSGAAVSVLPSEVSFDVPELYASLSLAVGGPDGSIFRESAEVASSLSFSVVDQGGASRVEGTYSYELRGQLDAESKPALLRSGFFSIRDGAFVSPDIPEGGFEKDQQILDDLIIQGSACIGVDCVDGESFGFTILRLKENNTRLEFRDTSNTAEFPGTDWQLVANDSNNGGANRFSIEDLTANTTPFTVMGAAPNNSLVVDAGGQVGIGTSVMSLDLHLLSDNTPGVRLEQDGSAGFSEQTWDVASNETNFFIRDVTSGDLLPFRILTGAPQNSQVIDAEGNVGLGTQTPSARLDVNGDIALSGTVDGRDIAADGSTLDAHVGDFNNPHQVTAEQVGAVSQASLDAHTGDFNNPHQVTAEQVGAVSQASLDAHTGDFNNPHQVTAAQVGAATQSALDSHVADFNNPHQVTAAQVGAATQSALDSHVADFNNPHQVTAAQVGAATQSALDAHVADFNNPHQVTAAQVGADPAGTAATEAAAAAALALAAHEAAFNHANLPSALPVPVAEGGTGGTDAASARAALGIEDDPTKVGIVLQADFSGNPALATVTFATPFPTGTRYVVSLTAQTERNQRVYTPNVRSKDENGFTITLGGNSNRLVEVGWVARPVTE